MSPVGISRLSPRATSKPIRPQSTNAKVSLAQVNVTSLEVAAAAGPMWAWSPATTISHGLLQSPVNVNRYRIGGDNLAAGRKNQCGHAAKKSSMAASVSEENG